MSDFQRYKKYGAFTFVEWMIVVAIISTLAAIAIPNFFIKQCCNHWVNEEYPLEVAKAECEKDIDAQPYDNYMAPTRMLPAEMPPVHGQGNCVTVTTCTSVGTPRGD